MRAGRIWWRMGLCRILQADPRLLVKTVTWRNTLGTQVEMSLLAWSRSTRLGRIRYSSSLSHWGMDHQFPSKSGKVPVVIGRTSTARSLRQEAALLSLPQIIMVRFLPALSLQDTTSSLGEKKVEMHLKGRAP